MYQTELMHHMGIILAVNDKVKLVDTNAMRKIKNYGKNLPDPPNSR